MLWVENVEKAYAGKYANLRIEKGDYPGVLQVLADHFMKYTRF